MLDDAHRAARTDHGRAAAKNRGVAIIGDGNIVITGDVDGHVSVTLSGQDLRPLELAYLDNLLALERVREWRHGYVSLAGHAEVEVSPQGAPVRLPRHLTRGYQVLRERGLAPQRRTERQPIDDLGSAVAQYRRVVLLGDPGSGKTTTLERLTYEYATTARDDPRAPLPLLANLGAYLDAGPLNPHLARAFGALAPHLAAYLEDGRVVLLLDALNEMPRADYKDRVRRICALLDRCPRVMVVVTCRELDYPRDALDLTQFEISPLDEGRIRLYLQLALGPERGDLLYDVLGGITPKRLRAWLREKVPPGYRDRVDAVIAQLPPVLSDADLRAHLIRCSTDGQLGPADWWRADGSLGGRFDRFRASLDRPLLELGRNPYLLGMLVLTYYERGALPPNRGALFDACVNELLAREKKACDRSRWIPAGDQLNALAELAFAMQIGGRHGTAVSHTEAEVYLTHVTDEPDHHLYLAQSASLIEVQGDQVRFEHQLLQEYLAARGWERRIRSGDPLGERWPQGWWHPSGWEEMALLVAGMTGDLPGLVEWLLVANPPLAARCLLESGVDAPLDLRESVAGRLEAVMGDDALPLEARIQAGDALGVAGDPRFQLRYASSGTAYILPPVSDVIPADSFWMGSAPDEPGALPAEKPRHRAETVSYRIGLYPVTNAEYACFVRARGYQEPRHWTESGWQAHSHAKGMSTDYWRRRFWTEAGWSWRTRKDLGPPTRAEVMLQPNHPVVHVNWYEAVAYCHWLSEQSGLTVRLPSEPEWERAARGQEQRRFPWGGEFDATRCNTREGGVSGTTPVGLFSEGISPAGCHDMAGNVWEWTHSLWSTDETSPAFLYPYRPDDGRENASLGDEASRVLRGGAWNFEAQRTRCAFRDRLNPRARVDYVGFRIVVLVPEA
jgi:formylglycine-generating enzyme required for sulfatase activity